MSDCMASSQLCIALGKLGSIYKSVLHALADLLQDFGVGAHGKTILRKNDGRRSMLKS